ncbi:MAG: DNA recombination protein RmuC [Micrococcales bacterium]|jgi:DNA recombination protein RmuC|nr:DNA recombination protein RmuC [Micrococcales bacterium]MBT5398576.1 DNA recombination protein RmuC [Micrococcales bacterium]MBT5847773.1 DNA recombination protein RmuC [Micrococcales bacterium]HBB39264.1 DNA recombination protein RmuC [Aquiluna sp.]
MQDSIWLIVVTLLISSGAGFLIGMLWQKNRTPATDSSLAAKLAGLEATERELRAQLAKSEQTISTQAQQTDKENKILVQLEPVKQQLLQMQDVVQRLEKERTEQFSSISEQLRASIETDENLRKQTQQLSQALSSNSLRGVWGETQLRKLVELAGLIKHADFAEQATIKTDNGTGRADMVINLPGGKSLAIDSKVPFNSYQEASSISELAGGEEANRRAILIKEHVAAVRKHIDDLGTKAYWSGLDSSPDFVICFVPSESLLSAALDADPSLMEYAFKKNVALSSPVSLFSVLKTINYIWRQNADESQVRAMIKLGKELYERVGKIAALAQDLGNKLTSTVKSYNAFVSSLESRMLVTARKLNDLDENELGIDTIVEPKQLDDAPSALTSKELSED